MKSDNKIKPIIAIAVSVVIIGVMIFNTILGQTPADVLLLPANQVELTDQTAQNVLYKSKVFYNEALRQLINSDTTLALGYIDSSIIIAPTFIPSHILKQDIYTELNIESELRTIYDSLSVEFPFNAHYMYLSGRFKTLDESTAEYLKSIELNKYFAWPHIGLGENYLVKGKFPEAVKEFETAVKINPAIPEGQFGLGLSYDQNNQLDLAESQYLKSIIINEKMLYDSYMYLGLIFEEKQDTVLALENFNKFLEFAGQTPERELVNSKISSLDINMIIAAAEDTSATKK